MKIVTAKKAMERKIVVLSLSAMLFAFSFSVEGQQTRKLHRIGYLALGSRSAGTEAFVQGLKELGYVERQNIVIEYRWAEGGYDRLPTLAAEILRLDPSVIVVGGSAAARAVKQVTKTIPIVIPDSADPVGGGLVKSLARPDGNITGLTIMSPQLSGKRLELLKETFPTISQAGVVVNSANPEREAPVKETVLAAEQLRVRAQIIAVREANAIEGTFPLMVRKRVQAFVLIPTPMFTYYRKLIVDLAAKNRLPAIYPHRGFVEDGGLMSYAANIAELYRRAAYFVDRILKGAKPAELPVEQPTKFELVVNMKSAKELGLTIPPKVLMWADRVIE
jgi:ABC-type uncharacterized transport system substrate-binding protein